MNNLPRQRAGATGQLPTPAPLPPRTLLPEHIEELRKSGLTEADARAAGLYSEVDSVAIGRLLNWEGPAKTLGPCLVFPFLDCNGQETGYHQVKPRTPLQRKSKSGPNSKDKGGPKYESPRDKEYRPYIPPRTRAALSDPTSSLLITEGVKKSLAADKNGFACVGLTGVDCWSKRREKGANDRRVGPRLLIEDLAAIAWAGRRVFIVFDSDAVTNESVRRAEDALAAAVADAGADVRIVRLPVNSEKPEEKVGLDDYLLDHTPDDLRALLAAAETFTPRVSLMSLTTDEHPHVVTDVATSSREGITNGTSVARPPGEPVTADQTPEREADPDDTEAILKSEDRKEELTLMAVYQPELFAAELARLRKKIGSTRAIEAIVKRRAAAVHSRDLRNSNRVVGPVIEPYEISGNAFWYMGSNPPRRMCNFTAFIVSETITDDGTADKRLTARIVGKLYTGEDLPEIQVTADEFREMRWVEKKWGLRPSIDVGMEERVRQAIKSKSNIRREVAYKHTGWRVIDGQQVYLHAEGAIGANGSITGLKTSLEGDLAAYQLCVPVNREEEQRAVRASLDMLRDLASDEVAIPLLIAPYRAVLGPTTYTLTLLGATGAYKSALAGLAMAHCGPRFNGGRLKKLMPASFEDTAKNVGEKQFLTKDSLLVTDDYCPSSVGSRKAAEDQTRVYHTVVRSQGNLKGRGRMNADITLREDRPPRGMTFITAEEVPPGTSTNGRQFIVQVPSGSVNKSRLSECQTDGKVGLYAKSLGGFVRAIAADLDGIRARFESDAERRATELDGVGGHARCPTTLGDLLAALDVFLRYAVRIKAIETGDANRIADRAAVALRAVADQQRTDSEDTKPAENFLRRLGAVLSSGKAHVADEYGGPPIDEQAVALGWRKEFGSSDWKPHGPRIGHIRGKVIYVNQHLAVGQIEQMMGGKLDGVSTLGRELFAADQLAEITPETATEKRRFTVRKTFEGARDVSLFALHAKRFCATDSDEG